MDSIESVGRPYCVRLAGGLSLASWSGLAVNGGLRYNLEQHAWGLEELRINENCDRGAYL